MKMRKKMRKTCVVFTFVRDEKKLKIIIERKRENEKENVSRRFLK
jgi:hypothetical protein